MFKSEFLICCGNIDIIICERRDMNFTLINSFNLTLKGNIKNLTLENHNDTYVELLYSNETLRDDNIYNIYEYDIYPPKCKNINIIQINNGNSGIEVNSLFERITNTNYYITLDMKSSAHLMININNNYFYNSFEKIKIDPTINQLYFKLKDIEVMNNININYNISIDETYLDSCTISFIYNSSFLPCEICNDLKTASHYCIKCKENNYFFPKKGSDCFKEDEINSKNFSYYLDIEYNIFVECDYSKCHACNGPDENNCLNCKNETSIIYSGKCSTECPNETFKNYISFKNKIYQDFSNTELEIGSSISNNEDLKFGIDSTIFEINNTKSKIEISSLEVESIINLVESTESSKIEQNESDMEIKSITSIIKDSTSKTELTTKETKFTTTNIEISTLDVNYSTTRTEFITQNSTSKIEKEIDISESKIELITIYSTLNEENFESEIKLTTYESESSLNKIDNEFTT